MDNEEQDLVAPQAEMAEACERLKKAREAAGKDPHDLGIFVNASPAYYDLENCDGDLYRCIDVGKLAALCSELGIKSRELFGGKKTSPAQFRPSS